MKRIAMIAIVVGMICFFLPYLVVRTSSFWSGNETHKASGFELMTTISLHEDLDFDDEDSPDTYLILAFACALLSIIVVAGVGLEERKQMLISGVLSLCAFLFLILFRSNYVEMANASGAGSFVQMEFGLGWILSVATFVCAGGCLLIEQYFVGKQDQAARFQSQTIAALVKPIPDETTGGKWCYCPVCKTKQLSGQDACLGCGVRFVNVSDK